MGVLRIAKYRDRDGTIRSEEVHGDPDRLTKNCSDTAFYLNGLRSQGHIINWWWDDEGEPERPKPIYNDNPQVTGGVLIMNNQNQNLLNNAFAEMLTAVPLPLLVNEHEDFVGYVADPVGLPPAQRYNPRSAANMSANPVNDALLNNAAFQEMLTAVPLPCLVNE